LNTLQTSLKAAPAADEIDLGEVGVALRRHWRRIAAVIGVTSLLAVAYVLLATPKFTVTGSLYLGDARAVAPATENSGPLSFLSQIQSISDINTQIDLINSKSLIQQAVLESGFNASIAPKLAPKMSYWKWVFLYGRDVDAFAPRPWDLQAADATLARATVKPQRFNIVMGENGAYRIFGDGGWFHAPVPMLSGTLGVPAAGNGLSLLLKTADDGAVPPAGSVYVMKLLPAEVVADDLQSSGALAAAAGGQINNPTKIANLKLLSADPYAGQRLVGQLMTDFITSQVSWNSGAASATETFIAQQLNDVKASLLDADQKLAAYQGQTGILDVPANASAAIGQLSQYEMQRTGLLLQQQALAHLSDEVNAKSGRLNPYLVGQANDSVLTTLAGNLADAEQKLRGLQVQFTESAPDVQVQEAQVADIQSAIRSIVDNDKAAADNNLAKMDAVIAGYNQRLKAMPAQSLQVIALTRASDVYGQLYVTLMQKQEEAEVSKAAAIVNTRVVAPAQVPLDATWPKGPMTVAIGAFVGLLGGVGWTLGQRALSFRFQSDDEIREAIPLPVYGLVPLRSSAEVARSIFPTRPQTAFAEAFRLLRSNIYRSAPGMGPRVLLVTSAGIDDGKTMVAANLAKMLADDKKSVILVDADLHVGRVDETLNTKGANGLTEWLVSTKRPLLQKVPGQRFMILSAGSWPPNPSELLNEPKFAEVIATLRAEFDYVVIDSPPFPTVSDGMALGAQADLILSVVRLEHTERRLFALHEEAISRMERRHGLIINGVARNSYGYGYAYRPGSRTGQRLRKMLSRGRPERDEVR
jgi:capsular exopolysaccharide synthesis family protein